MNFRQDRDIHRTTNLKTWLTEENSVSHNSSERWWYRKSSFKFSGFRDSQSEISDEHFQQSGSHQALKYLCPLELEKTENQFQMDYANKEIIVGERQFLEDQRLTNAGCQTDFFGLLDVQIEPMSQLVRKAVKGSSKSGECDVLPASGDIPVVTTCQHLNNSEDVSKVCQATSLPLDSEASRGETIKTSATVTSPALNIDNEGLPSRLNFAPGAMDVPGSIAESHTKVSIVTNLSSQTNSANDKSKDDPGIISRCDGSVYVSPRLFEHPKCTPFQVNCDKLVSDIGCREFFQSLTDYENITAILCEPSKNNHSKACIKPFLNDFMQENQLGKLNYKDYKEYFSNSG